MYTSVTNAARVTVAATMLYKGIQIYSISMRSRNTMQRTYIQEQVLGLDVAITQHIHLNQSFDNTTEMS